MTLPYPFSRGFEFRKCKRYDDRVQAKLGSLYEEHGHRTVIEEKLDGWRVLYARDPESGELALYSRGINVEGGRTDLLKKFGEVPDLEALILGAGDAVEGELLWQGHRAAEVPTALKTEAGRAQLQFFGYGYPFEAGQELPLMATQREALDTLECRRPKTLCYGAHQLSLEMLLKYAKVHRTEGWIVKELDTADGGWWKVKREVTVDVVVLGSTDAEPGKFEGLIGALTVGIVCRDPEVPCWELDTGRGLVRVREVSNVSGMDDASRREMSSDRDALVGRVCEIECQAVGGKNDGKLRHARFIRWREDKPLEECDGREIFSELNIDTESPRR